MAGRDGFDFSFSGLKTALRLRAGRRPAEADRADLAASYQAGDRALAGRSHRRRPGRRPATTRSRWSAEWPQTAPCARRSASAARRSASGYRAAPLALCSDNAAMIASAARFTRPCPIPSISAGTPTRASPGERPGGCLRGAALPSLRRGEGAASARAGQARIRPRRGGHQRRPGAGGGLPRADPGGLPSKGARRSSTASTRWSSNAASAVPQSPPDHGHLCGAESPCQGVGYTGLWHVTNVRNQGGVVDL